MSSEGYKSLQDQLSQLVNSPDKAADALTLLQAAHTGSSNASSFLSWLLKWTKDNLNTNTFGFFNVLMCWGYSQKAIEIAYAVDLGILNSDPNLWFKIQMLFPICYQTRFLYQLIHLGQHRKTISSTLVAIESLTEDGVDQQRQQALQKSKEALSSIPGFEHLNLLQDSMPDWTIDELFNQRSRFHQWAEEQHLLTDEQRKLVLDDLAMVRSYVDLAKANGALLQSIAGHLEILGRDLQGPSPDEM